MGNAITRYLERLQPAARAFVPGPGAVDPSLVTFGVDPDVFSPEIYAEYLATSNGVYACAKLRATLLSSLPLRHYRLQGDGSRVEVERGRLHELTQKVNPYWTFNRLMEMTELSLSVWGSAYWFIERGASGTGAPRELWWARPDRVRVVPHPTDYVSHFLYEPVNGAAPIRFEREEVVWLRYSNPIDEFSGLSPLAAARIAADVSGAAMKSNRNLFSQGIQMGGLVMPTGSTPLTEDQARQLEESLTRRFRGVDKAHRWGVMRIETKFQPMSLSPKDAEFLGAMKTSLEDIARAYGVPQDLVGGQRTYENVQAAMKILWQHTIVPEARFIATELTEQLLPMFAGADGADLCEFDLSQVDVLKEDQMLAWTIAKEKLAAGVMTINDYRGEVGEDPVAWGDAWWAPISVQPVTSGEMPMLPAAAAQPEPHVAPEPGQPDEDGDIEDDQPRAAAAGAARIAYGGEEHRRIWEAYVRAVTPGEETARRAVEDLMRRQQQSVLDTLRRRGARAAEEAAADPFDRARWVRLFRVTMRPVLTEIADGAGADAAADIGGGYSWNVSDPNVRRVLERRAQRFAIEVNETTWERLRLSLSEGVGAGEGVPELAARVEQIMGARIRSDARTIARTETIGSYNEGRLESWRQSGRVAGKVWIAALDERTRDTHLAAHDQEVGFGDLFLVGDGAGPAPGSIGLPEEDINCRCAMAAVLRDQ